MAMRDGQMSRTNPESQSINEGEFQLGSMEGVC